MHNNKQKKKYKIGTRASLLALTQSEQIKDQLTSLTGDSFELVKIKTEGDLNTSAPLWQIDGKDFFTKELDHALQSKEVDLVIHSYKDLGSERPEGIQLAAITKRTFPQDILLIKNKTIENIKNNQQKTLVVGTSSPRRMVNIEKELLNFLPIKKNNRPSQKIEIKSLRGNVNSRIKKLQDDQYHAIVLALAGIERLSLSPSPKEELSHLLKDLNYMVLPLSSFPSAASQGALGIEILKSRNDQNELLNKIKLLNDDNTIEEVKRERKKFQEYGGGCHLAVGITVQKIKDHYIHFEKGQVDERSIDQIKTERKYKLPSLSLKNTFLGLPIDHEYINGKTIIGDALTTKSASADNQSTEIQDNNLYVTTYNAKEILSKLSSSRLIWTSGAKAMKQLSSSRLIWTSGAKAMKQLSSDGHWINGTADSRGEKEFAKMLLSNALSLMSRNNNKWSILTNDQGSSKIGTTVSAYKRVINQVSSDFSKQVEDAEVFFWSSFWQYQVYVDKYPIIKNRIHCCGMGKTFDSFQENNIDISSLLETK